MPWYMYQAECMMQMLNDSMFETLSEKHVDHFMYML